MIFVSLRIFIPQVWPSLLTLRRNYCLWWWIESDWAESKRCCQSKVKLTPNHNTQTEVQSVERQQHLNHFQWNDEEYVYVCLFIIISVWFNIHDSLCVCACVYMNAHACIWIPMWMCILICLNMLYAGLGVSPCTELSDLFVSHFEHNYQYHLISQFLAPLRRCVPAGLQITASHRL